MATIYALQVSKRLINLVEGNHLNDEEVSTLVNYLDMLKPVNNKTFFAYIRFIKPQGTPEQIGKWWNTAKSHAIIGCYAQIELSRGSHVVGLATTASFDIRTDEFIIHSPNIMSTKWWIGELGVASTHSVVQAQLVIGIQNVDLHLFIVHTHSPSKVHIFKLDLIPCSGIKVGDIGPKACDRFVCVDNGCEPIQIVVLFDHVRISRENMLMKFAKVTKSGEYIPPVHGKLSYGSMVNLRVHIVYDAALKLAKIVAISTQYCTV
ncbi:acyl-CoA dehydrogenase NM domain-like protein [Backusella circina FSU 941]|nr:acyl-CoA dehydrogenase NM domain-like protein [Backusella circina FSU 941]